MGNRADSGAHSGKYGASYLPPSLLGSSAGDFRPLLRRQLPCPRRSSLLASEASKGAGSRSHFV